MTFPFNGGAREAIEELLRQRDAAGEEIARLTMENLDLRMRLDRASHGQHSSLTLLQAMGLQPTAIARSGAQSAADLLRAVWGVVVGAVVMIGEPSYDPRDVRSAVELLCGSIDRNIPGDFEVSARRQFLEVLGRPVTTGQ
jgi:hypothetical protein